MITTMRLGLMALLLASIAACASRPPLTQLAQPACATTLDLRDSQRLGLDSGQPLEHRFGQGSRCLTEIADTAPHAATQTVYAVFHLPTAAQPYTISIDSIPVGDSLFAPEVLMLDADGAVRRTLPWERFNRRGSQLNATVFVDQQNNRDERYLVVKSANAAVGRRGSRLDSGSFFLPLFNVLFPVMYVHGTETAREYVLAHDGLVQMQARSAGKSRRGQTAQDRMRAELAGH